MWATEKAQKSYENLGKTKKKTRTTSGTTQENQGKAMKNKGIMYSTSFFFVLFLLMLRGLFGNTKLSSTVFLTSKFFVRCSCNIFLFSFSVFHFRFSFSFAYLVFCKQNLKRKWIRKREQKNGKRNWKRHDKRSEAIPTEATELPAELVVKGFY